MTVADTDDPPRPPASTTRTGTRPMPTPTGPRGGCSTPSVRVSPPAAPSSFSTSPRVLAADSTDPERRSPRAFSETDFSDDLRALDVPIVIAQGDDDQIVPIAAAAEKTMTLVKHGTLKVYPGTPHGIAGEFQRALDDDILAWLAE